MSALKVLQSCPTQRKALLKAISGIDPMDTNLIIFDLEDHIPRLPPQLAFQIQVIVSTKTFVELLSMRVPRRVSCLLPAGKPSALPL
jgi:hypothetical protein